MRAKITTTKFYTIPKKADLERNGYIVHSACFRVQSDCVCINNAQTFDGVLSTALLEVAPEHLQTQQTSERGGGKRGGEEENEGDKRRKE